MLHRSSEMKLNRKSDLQQGVKIIGHGKYLSNYLKKTFVFCSFQKIKLINKKNPTLPLIVKLKVKYKQRYLQ